MRCAGALAVSFSCTAAAAVGSTSGCVQLHLLLSWVVVAGVEWLLVAGVDVLDKLPVHLHFQSLEGCAFELW